MTNNPLLLKIWGAGISALGLWYVISWVQNSDSNKDGYSLAVGIFCLLVGTIVIALHLKSRGKGKDE